MYEGIKQAFGPVKRKTAPLKTTDGEILQEPEQQMSR
jgi:hypothetical protein